MRLKKDKWIIILRLVVACVLFTIASMCFGYALVNKDTIQWYWLGLCISGIFIGYVSAIIIAITTFID